MRFNLTRTLYAGAAFLAFAGLVLRVAPAAAPSAAAPQVAVARVEDETGGSRPPTEEAFAPIVADNIFDQDRSPPTERYMPPELAVEEAPQRPPVRPRGPRLFGVAVGPTGAVALIDADPTIPGAEVYRIGDLVAGSRLIEIGDTAVVLEVAGGRRVLTLPSSSRRLP